MARCDTQGPTRKYLGRFVEVPFGRKHCLGLAMLCTGEIEDELLASLNRHLDYVMLSVERVSRPGRAAAHDELTGREYATSSSSMEMLWPENE